MGKGGKKYSAFQNVKWAPLFVWSQSRAQMHQNECIKFWCEREEKKKDTLSQNYALIPLHYISIRKSCLMRCWVPGSPLLPMQQNLRIGDRGLSVPVHSVAAGRSRVHREKNERKKGRVEYVEEK